MIEHDDDELLPPRPPFTPECRAILLHELIEIAGRNVASVGGADFTPPLSTRFRYVVVHVREPFEAVDFITKLYVRADKDKGLRRALRAVGDSFLSANGSGYLLAFEHLRGKAPDA